MVEARRTKVAVLGGGQAALTAAFQLTDPGNPRHREFDVTVYQIGWRLGGKGATGRNTDPGFHGRIEEHGFHNWFGFYDNSFRQIQDCYAELGRAPGTPLATWQEAFVPGHEFVFMESFNGRQSEWLLRAPPNDDTPGRGRGFLPLWEYLLMLVEALHDLFHAPPADDSAGTVRAPTVARWHLTVARHLARMMSRQPVDERARRHGMAPARPLAALEKVPLALRHLIPGGVARWSEDAIGKLLVRSLRLFASALWPHVKAHVDNDEVRRGWILGNFAYGCIIGMISDDLIHRGLDAINNQDFRPWLAKYAFPDGDLMMNSPVVRSVYDSSFSYENGDTSIPPGATFPPAAQYEAGTVLRGIIRGLFTYRGALTYRFAAGTGDSCYVPMYQVLKRRGVKFKFFHRVEALRPGVGPGRPIDRITIARQVDLRAGAAAEYDPLTTIKALPCWPHRPLFDQLVGGDELARDWKDLEDPPDDFRDAGREVLERGRDFDMVVLGIPVGAHHEICAPLVAQSGRWRRMIERVKTVRTQALQTWTSCTAAGLGWAVPGQDIASVLWEYDRQSLLNVWGDLTEVAKWEDWPEGQSPGNIAYFCGPMRDDPPPAAGEAPRARPTATSERDKVRQAVLNLLSNGVDVMWKNACQQVGGARAFRWELLVDQRPGAPPAGEARIDAQYFRANVSDSERFVLSLPGSSQYRLPANDPTEFSNLYLAGDWTQCTINAGCMEAATISGMLCSEAISGYPLRHRISGVDF